MDNFGIVIAFENLDPEKSREEFIDDLTDHLAEYVRFYRGKLYLNISEPFNISPDDPYLPEQCPLLDKYKQDYLAVPSSIKRVLEELSKPGVIFGEDGQALTLQDTDELDSDEFPEGLDPDLAPTVTVTLIEPLDPLNGPVTNANLKPIQ